MLQKKSLRKSDLAIALSVAMLGMTFGLTGCNNDNDNNDDNQTTSSQTVEEQIAALNTDQASLRSHERFWDIQVHQNRFDL
ncbi:MAG: hypothetical protein ABW068_16835 [Candidatus Thiodiazotropha sp.]